MIKVDLGLRLSVSDKSPTEISPRPHGQSPSLTNPLLATISQQLHGLWIKDTIALFLLPVKLINEAQLLATEIFESN
jgi:hypothetical protein